MAPTRRKQKFVLNVKKLEATLEKARKTAARGIVAGKRRVADAKKKGDKKRLKANKANLAGAVKAQLKLKKAVRLVAQTCCDQFFGCDPEFF
jgi:hypothetical protein